jgi:hypothetical protein
LETPPLNPRSRLCLARQPPSHRSRHPCLGARQLLNPSKVDLCLGRPTTRLLHNPSRPAVFSARRHRNLNRQAVCLDRRQHSNSNHSKPREGVSLVLQQLNNHSSRAASLVAQPSNSSHSSRPQEDYLEGRRHRRNPSKVDCLEHLRNSRTRLQEDFLVPQTPIPAACLRSRALDPRAGFCTLRGLHLFKKPSAGLTF